MHRFSAGSGVYFSEARPVAVNGAAESHIAAAVADADRGPDLLYWNLRLEDDGETVGEIVWGRGGLDLLLASHIDLSACVAIEADTFKRIADKLTSRRDSFRQVLDVLVRTPGLVSTYVPQLRGSAPSSIAAESPDRDDGVRPVSIETISVAILSDQDDDDLTEILEAVGRQTVVSKLEVLALIFGSDGVGAKRRSQQVEAFGAGARRMRTRRFIASGDFDRAYAANTAVMMATGEVVIFLDTRSLPASDDLLQRLANWASHADVASVSARLEHDGRVVCTGLTLSASADEELGPCDDQIFVSPPHLCAAPNPWVFAVPRRAWAVSGGLRRPGVLWTAGMAGAEGPRGRHVVLGSEVARWSAATFPDVKPVRSPLTLRLSSRAAVRASKSIGRSAVAPKRTPAPAKLDPRPATPRRARSAAAPSPAFADPPPIAAKMRVLVFADAMGASQAIAFVEGLAAARRRGEVVVSIYTEQALHDHGDVAAAVATILKERSPTVIVVSRMADAVIWQAVSEQAAAQRLPLVFHIDDDLFDPPVVLGVERYRRAQHPRRLHTLHAALNACDLAIAASEVLGAKLARIAAHDRIAVMSIGSAARPAAIRPRLAGDGLVVAYMGSASHAHDLAMIAPALNRVLADYDHVGLTLFGSIASQAVCGTIAGRVRREPGVYGDYAAFRNKLSGLRFDIGLAPLATNAFNRAKTPTKWVEYAEAGVAVLASDIEPYRPVGRAGALVLAGDDEWAAALSRMIEDADLRRGLVERSDSLLRRDFGWDRLEKSMLELLGGAMSRLERAA